MIRRRFLTIALCVVLATSFIYAKDKKDKDKPEEKPETNQGGEGGKE